MIRGYISFTMAGTTETRTRPGRQTFDAARDENAVVVGYTQREEFVRLREAIEAAIERVHTVGPVNTPVAPDPSDQLRKLTELHNDGLLSDEEFEAKRAEIIDRM